MSPQITNENGENSSVAQNRTPITVKISHYDPTKGGVNCLTFVNGECISKMANGEKWQNYWGMDNTIACPKELPFGTQIDLDGKIYTCRDRGGKIVVTNNGEYWIDILHPFTPYKYGTVREAYIIAP